MLTVCSITGFLVLYLNTPGSPGTFSKSVLAAMPGAAGVRALDLDGDGDVDIVVVGVTQSAVYVLRSCLQDGAGAPQAFVPSKVFPAAVKVSTGVPAVDLIEVADVDGDGTLDLLAGSTTSDMIVWITRDPGSKLDDPAGWTTLPVALPVGGLLSMAAGDVDAGVWSCRL
jgi:hypothetical protein